MTKLKKQRKKKTYNYGRNRKRVRKQQERTNKFNVKVDCQTMKDAWDNRISVKENVITFALYHTEFHNSETSTRTTISAKFFDSAWRFEQMQKRNQISHCKVKNSIFYINSQEIFLNNSFILQLSVFKFCKG